MATEAVWHAPVGDRRRSFRCAFDGHEHECRNDDCPHYQKHGVRLKWKHDRCSSGLQKDHECPECGEWNGYRTDGSPET